MYLFIKRKKKKEEKKDEKKKDEFHMKIKKVYNI